MKQILTTRPPTPREEIYHVCTVQGGAQVTAKCSHLHTEIFLSSTDQNRRHHPLTTRQSEIIKIFFSHLAPAVSCYKVLNEYIILSIPVRDEEEDTQKKADLKSPSGEVNLDLCTVEDDHRQAHTLSKIIFSPFCVCRMPCRFVRFWWDLIESCINLI